MGTKTIFQRPQAPTPAPANDMAQNIAANVGLLVNKNSQPPDCGFQNSAATKDSNQFEYFTINTGTGPRLNVPINLAIPRHSIEFTGATGGGSGNGITLSFAPVPGVGDTPDTAAGLYGFSLVANQPLVFRKPISQFLISFADSGQPDVIYVFRMTDDKANGGITLSVAQ